MRALVTGGAGFIGSHVVDRLVDEGWSVLAVDDLSKGKVSRLAAARQRGDVKFHQLDIVSPELVDVAERFAPEAIYHLAAQSAVRASVEDPLHDARVNIIGTVNLLEAARRSGTGSVVFASSGGAIYGSAAKLPARESYAKHPDSPYGISKKVVEDYFHYYRAAFDIDYGLMAFANVYGPRQDPHGEAGVVAIFANAMLEGRQPVIHGDGSQTRDYVYVEDVVDALLRAAPVAEGRLYNIGTGLETSVLELYRQIAAITEYEGEPHFGEPKAGDVPRNVVDPSLAAKHLDWQPFTSLEEGLQRTVDSFRQQND